VVAVVAVFVLVQAGQAVLVAVARAEIQTEVAAK
jgi:hypothetical protein